LFHRVEQWRRPSGYYIPERDLPFRAFNYAEVSSGNFLHVAVTPSPDPLIVTALFGPVESVTDLLSLDVSISSVTQDSAWTYAGILLGRHYYSAIKLLFQHETFKSTLHSAKFFYVILDRLTGGGERDARRPELEEFIEYLIGQLRDDLLDFGNSLFCRTAENGCLLMIRKLWAAAGKDPGLRQALLTPTAGHPGKKESYYHHQSIGLAACNGHADVVRFLCQQPELEPHLRYINGAGLTVFHQATRLLNEEVVVTLARHWPEGVNVRDKDGSTPLGRLIDGRHRSDEDRAITFTRIFLHEGKADATGRDDNPGESPLCIAIRRGHVALLRILVVEGGADVSQVVTIDEATGRPALVESIQTYDDDAEGLRDQMLKELCSLLPLAVSVEYLT
jgi:ankyrin repeat protein